MKIELPDCDNCPLYCRQVGPRGPIDADIVIIGESPGAEEIKKRQPFVGPSGKILFKEIPEHLHGKVFITNALQCKPPRKKEQALMVKAAKACQNRLRSEIEAFPRKLIITLGNAATWSTTGNYAHKITKARGRLITSELASVGVLPIIHPAALMHGSGSYEQFKEDMAYAFDLASGQPAKTPIKPEVIIADDDTFKEIIERILAYDIVAGDIESEGLNRQHDDILCLGVCGDPKEAFVFPEEHLADPSKKDQFNKVFRLVKWIWHNGKFDIALLRRESFHARVDEDTMLLSYCLDEAPGNHGLEQLSKNLLGSPDYKSMASQYLPKKSASWRLIPTKVLYKYNGLDISNTLQVFNILRPKVHADANLEKLYTEILIPASEFLYHVENRGMLVDQQRLDELKDPDNPDSVYSKVQDGISKICKIAGYEINPNSPKQIGTLLFEEIGLRIIKRTPSGAPSTDKKVLAKLPDHPAVVAIRKYRKVAKQYSTYVIGTEKQIDPDTGLVHTTFNIHGTRTGRLSSKKPNIQNVPRDPLIRGMYIARPGYQFIEVDLNQAELRCLAQLSGDPDLIAIYNDPEHPGLHHEVSVKLFGKDYTGEDKMRGKAVNFGIVYGREAKSLADEFDVPLPEAQRWIDGWAERFPVAWEFIGECRQAPVRGATMTTLFGRKKRHHIVTKETLKELQNQAANFPHQSIASDITLKAGYRMRPKLKLLDCHITDLIHDSNLFEAPLDQAISDKATRLAIDEMESIAPEMGLLKVPFTADAKSGPRWGSLEDYKFAS